MQGKIPFHASTPLTELLCRGNTLNSLGSSRAGAMGGTQVLTLTPSQKYFGPPEERGGGGGCCSVGGHLQRKLRPQCPPCLHITSPSQIDPGGRPFYRPQAQEASRSHPTHSLRQRKILV